jgi:hypothetical protein
MRDKWMEREKEIERGRDKERERERKKMPVWAAIFILIYFPDFRFFSLPILVSGVKQGLSEEEEEEEEERRTRQ